MFFTDCQVKSRSRKQDTFPEEVNPDGNASIPGAINGMFESMRWNMGSIQKVVFSAATHLETATNSVGERQRDASQDRRPEKIKLSTFNPKHGNVRDWITDVERARDMYGWDEYELMHRITPYLIGEVLELFEKWKVLYRKWSNFIMEFLLSLPRKIYFGMRF